MGQDNSNATRLIPEFIATGKRSFEDFAEMQAELLSKMQQANTSWIDAFQKRAALASDFATKLSTARSMPDTATAFQDWMSHRMELAAEDAKHILVDTEMFLEAGARLLSHDWLPNGKGKS